jgi:hypothetical protein
VVTHHYGGGKMRPVQRAEQFIRLSMNHTLRQWKMRRVGVRRPVIDQRDLPVQARSKFNNRRGIRAGTQQQELRRQGQGEGKHPQAWRRRFKPTRASGTRRFIENRIEPGMLPGPPQGDRPHGRLRRLRFDNDSDRGALVVAKAAGHMSQRLPIVLRPHTDQQNVHGPFAPQPQSPNQIVATAHVVGHETRFAGVDHGPRVLAQIAFQATTRKQSGRIAVGGDEHQRAGLAIGRAGSVHERSQGNCPACSTLAFK